MNPLPDFDAARVFFFSQGVCECDPARVDLLGGKGASLAAMSRAGFPVPPGFTISARCCAWVQERGRWPDGLEEDVRAALARLEQLTDRTFGRGPRPLLVAVRSGAPVSMPGMMDTILNCGLHPGLLGTLPADRFWRDYADHVRMFAASVADLTLPPHDGDAESRARTSVADFESRTGRRFPTDPWESLRQCIDAVFASWNSERARAYRQRHDVRGLIGTAVNVQQMFPSERSGVLFTANPNDFSAGEMILEASWGLGEAVVSGAVTPDIYVLDARTLALKRTTPGDRPGAEPALAPAQIDEVAELGRRVEEHFRVPSDIEWGIADGRVALLQTRAIRGLDVLRDAEAGRVEEIERLQRQVGFEHVVWVVHNLAETLPAPTPLTWDLVRWFMSGQGGYGRMYRELGYRTSRTVDSEGFLELICGRIYADPRRAAGVFFGDLPFEYDMDELLADRQLLERPPTKLNVERADPLFFLRLPGLVWSLWRTSRRMRRLAPHARPRFDAAVVKLRSFLGELPDLSKLSPDGLIAELDRRVGYVLGEFAAESLLPGFFAGLAYGRLTRWLVQLLGSESGEDLAKRLTTGLEGDPTVRQNVLLDEVAHGTATLATFLDEFGHRATGEMDLSQPRWREDPDYVQRLVDGFRATNGAPRPAERHERQVATRKQAEADLPRLLAEAGGSSLRERIEGELLRAQHLLPYRETGKYWLMRGYESLRAVLMELASRWDLGRDVFFLQLDELPGYERHRPEYADRIARRKLRWRSAQKLTLRDVIDSRALDTLGQPEDLERAEGRAVLEGRPIATGTATGTARLVFDPHEARDLGTDYVLVCPSTDPGWTPLFVNARGLIVERGGILSHGAIVARDFGIPAVVCEQATRRIPDGVRLEIDATRGRVVLLDE